MSFKFNLHLLVNWASIQFHPCFCTFFFFFTRCFGVPWACLTLFGCESQSKSSEALWRTLLASAWEAGFDWEHRWYFHSPEMVSYSTVCLSGGDSSRQLRFVIFEGHLSGSGWGQCHVFGFKSNFPSAFRPQSVLKGVWPVGPFTISLWDSWHSWPLPVVSHKC